jgi:hypothetical protein
VGKELAIEVFCTWATLDEHEGSDQATHSQSDRLRLKLVGVSLSTGASSLNFQRAFTSAFHDF